MVSAGLESFFSYITAVIRNFPLPPLWRKVGMGGDAAPRLRRLALWRARALRGALPPTQLRLSSLCSLSFRNPSPQGGRRVLILVSAALSACVPTETPQPHLTELTVLPGWQGDASLDAAPALLASCGVIETLSSDQALGIGGSPTEWTGPCAAIKEAKDDATLQQTLAVQFVALDPGAGTSALVTGYYEPELDGSRTRDAAHPYPLYRLPPDPTKFDRTQIDAGALKGKKLELLWVSD